MVLTKIMITCYFGITKLNYNWRNKRPFYRGNASLNFNQALIKIMGWLNMHCQSYDNSVDSLCVVLLSVEDLHQFCVI